jgi:putative oxidoreductase
MSRFLPLMLGPTTTGSRSADVGLLVTRIVGGLSLALAHGWGKVPPSPRFISRTEGMGFPLPEFFAWMAAFAEFGGGLLLAAGLFTRPAALLVMAHTLVIVFAAHAGDPFSAREKGVLFFAVAALHVLAGPGRYSIDRLIHARRAAAN